MDDNELISVCNNLKQLQEVMGNINSSVEGLTDSNLKEKMSKMSYVESAQMHLLMAEVSINMFYGAWSLALLSHSLSEKQGCRCERASNPEGNGSNALYDNHR